MTEAHTHGTEQLCEAGTNLYAHALREGRMPVEDVDNAPCLIDLGLLHPTVEDLDWLEPISPAVALHRLLRISEQRIANERQQEEELAETFAALMRFEGRRTPTADNPAIRVITRKRINPTITEAMAHASEEMLCVQPNVRYSDPHAQAARAVALDRDQALLDRGARIRTLYQHTLRHAPSVAARYEQLRGDAEARTLDEIPERLLLIDRTVAFVPASKDRKLALEIRQPAIVAFLATTFERFWRLASPMYPQVVHQSAPDNVTHRQRAIAALLIEGHTDAAIADRLGLNVRTARAHIAKLSATLGSESRAQLGYLIGQSGILDPEG